MEPPPRGIDSKQQSDNLRKSLCDNTNPSSSSVNEGGDLQHIKNLLLCHIDVVAEQHDLLTIRDKKINQLQEENSKLCSQIKKLENRLAQLKSSQSVINKNKHNNQKALTAVELEASTSNKHAKRKKTIKRLGKKAMRNDKGRDYLFEDLATSASPLSTACTKTKKRRRFSASSSVAISVHNDENMERLSVASSKLPSGGITVTDGQSSNSSTLRKQRQKKCESEAFSRTMCNIKKECKDTDGVNPSDHLDVMSTNLPYYVYQTAEEPELVIVEVKHEEGISVPTYREKKVVPYYCIEGTENFDDSVYEKRHQKWENEEKRRKRWDLQRLREQEQFRKLQAREQRLLRRNRHSSVQSLRPDPEAALSIEVCDSLLFSNFGCPIPKLSKSEFALSWASSNGRRNTETSRKSKGKKR